MQAFWHVSFRFCSHRLPLWSLAWKTPSMLMPLWLIGTTCLLLSSLIPCTCCFPWVGASGECLLPLCLLCPCCPPNGSSLLPSLLCWHAQHCRAQWPQGPLTPWQEAALLTGLSSSRSSWRWLCQYDFICRCWQSKSLAGEGSSRKWWIALAFRILARQSGFEGLFP